MSALEISAEPARFKGTFYGERHRIESLPLPA